MNKNERVNHQQKYVKEKKKINTRINKMVFE